MMGELKKLFKKYLINCTVFLLLMFAGSYIFVKLESLQEDVRKRNTSSSKEFRESLIKKYNITSTDLQILERTNTEDDSQDITFGRGLALTFSIAFTTGWGNVVPTTKASKIFFIFYSVIAICSAGIVFKSVSDILIILTNKVIGVVEKFLFGKTTKKYLSLKCTIFMTLLMLTFMTVTATVHYHMGQELVDAFYLTLQSYTTIGFGDIIPKREGPLIITFYFVWDSLGMAILAALLNSIIQLQVKDFKLIGKQIRKSIKSQRNTSYNFQQKGEGNYQSKVAVAF